MRREPEVKARILKTVRQLYEGITDLDVSLEGGTVQVFAQEDNITVPATRLSDGTLRFTDAHTPSTVCTPTRYA